MKKLILKAILEIDEIKIQIRIGKFTLYVYD
jgi:hypothetical protein